MGRRHARTAPTGNAQVTREELAEAFIEFAPLLETPCRFRNCQHENEPGCTLKNAVEEGKISRRRYESFLVLAHEAEGAR